MESKNRAKVVTLLALTAISANITAQTTKKNVLFIAVDDLKPILGCYGDNVAITPNIDGLADRGTRFTNAYCQYSVSGPSRASLLTGKYPDHTRVWNLSTLIRDVMPDVKTLPQHLISNGYETVGIGKIFDPRTVDDSQDVASWSVPYLNFADYYFNNNKPLYGSYQSDENRQAAEKYRQEAIKNGLTGNAIDEYVKSKVNPSIECFEGNDAIYSDGAILNGALKYLDSYRKDKPLFLAVGFKKPHLPFCAPKKYWDLYDRQQIPLATNRDRIKNGLAKYHDTSNELYGYSDIPEWASYSDIDNIKTLEVNDDKARELIHGYYACASYIDSLIGQLLDKIKEKGMLDNTIIVLWGDHGWHLGDHGIWGKHTNLEQATHAPLIIVDPSKTKQVMTKPVEFIDIYPTLCNLLGINVPEGLDGINLSDNIAHGDAASVNREIAVSQYRNSGMGYTFRTSEYRYTVWVKWSNGVTYPNDVRAEELYDMKNDPYEEENIISQKGMEAVADKMRNYWRNYINNIATTVNSPSETESIKYFITGDELNLVNYTQNEMNVEIYNSEGRVYYSGNIEGFSCVILPVASWAKGLYIVSATNKTKIKTKNIKILL